MTPRQLYMVRGPSFDKVFRKTETVYTPKTVESVSRSVASVNLMLTQYCTVTANGFNSHTCYKYKSY